MMLLVESPEGIHEYLNVLEKQSKALIKNIYELCWYMRGSITREEAWMLSEQERDIIFEEVIKDKIEKSKELGTPVF